MRNTQITIDLSALFHNINRVKQLAPTAKVLAMVKANAYGHGAVACLPALNNADALAVACLEEAIPLQQAGWQKPIVLIEGAFSLEEWQYATQNNLQCIVHHKQQLDWVLQHIAPNQTIWLKLNTGMNRLGFDEKEIVDIANTLHDKGYQLILTSHFANADDKNHPTNQQQIQIFENTLTTLRQTVSPTIQGSLCNSAGIVNFANQHHDWVRAGIMLYGATPVTDQTAKQLDLKPLMQFTASIIAIHDLQIGDCVGYGSRWQASKPCQIGIVSVGYADGYPRVVSNDAYVIANGQKLPIIGRVAMDMLMIDITDQAISLGTMVELWGNQLSIDHVATWNGTISYELLCLITKRPHWHYIASK